ncbi:MAG: hypothetical protein HY658_11685 [Actinobacteria bacterium]|nr:hypothetical protein [Actinomycetota bacterium]
MTWIDRVTGEVAGAAGMDPGELALSGSDSETLLDVARIASHSSGDRTNAPLLCYVMGLARSSGRSLEELAEAVRRSADEPAP